MRTSHALLAALLSSACDHDRWITPESTSPLDATASTPVATNSPTSAPDVLLLASNAPVARAASAAPIDAGVRIDVFVRDVTVRVDATRDAVLLATDDVDGEPFDAPREAAAATVIPVFVPVLVSVPTTAVAPSAEPVSPTISTTAPLGSTGTGGSLATQPAPLYPSVAGGVSPFRSQPPSLAPMPAGGTLPPISPPPTLTPSIAGGTSTIGGATR